MITLVYPPFLNFHRMFQRPQQLFTQLARQGLQAIYHDPGMSGRRPAYVEPEPNLILLSQDAPLGAVPHQPPVLWIGYPPYWRLIGRYYGERLVLFDICDAPSDEFAEWSEGTAQLLERADLVLCASWPLYQEYLWRHPRVYFCPNGVDYAHFSAAATAPSELTQLTGPIIGYHGAVASWLDWPLITELARLRPDWNFVFVGPLYNLAPEDLPALPNLIFTGERPYQELPGLVQAFGAGIIPFRMTEMTRASDPIKAYEYLAAGKGVVGTPLPMLEQNPHVTVAADAAGFAQALDGLLEGDSAEARQRWAQRHSWAQRARVIAAALQAFSREDLPSPAAAAPSPMQQEVARFLLEETPATSYLEVGAGTGLTSACLVGEGRRVAAVDRDAASLACLRRLWGVEVYSADMFDLPFGDGEFDVVWNAGVLEHYPRVKQVQALRQLARVARQAVVVAVPHRQCLAYHLGRQAAEERASWPYGYEEAFSTLLPLFEEAGLVMVKETDLCQEAGRWFLDAYLPDWRHSIQPEALGSAGYLLVAIGRPRPGRA